jgi:hypothetical protein
VYFDGAARVSWGEMEVLDDRVLRVCRVALAARAGADALVRAGGAEVLSVRDGLGAHDLEPYDPGFA